MTKKSLLWLCLRILFFCCFYSSFIKWVLWLIENVFQCFRLVVFICHMEWKCSEGCPDPIYSRQVDFSSRGLQIQQGEKQQELLTYCWGRRDTVLVPGFHLEVKMRKRETRPKRSVSKLNVFYATTMALQEPGSFFFLRTVGEVLNSLCSKML